ncbi:hypothetical protein EYC84_009280 [Monilinia fructicola]|uniref:DDE Tnp4 domain-containing protein n=1 Tax=Monilinia fructicola TaxID=38448 RepID=A0A5M9JA28_MONFR|nr:hypothetical protein EYC84_009280 [Monilinia fructicola]
MSNIEADDMLPMATALMFFMMAEERRPRYRYRTPFKYTKKEFDLTSMAPQNVIFWFRFTTIELQRLARLLKLENIKYPRRIKCPSLTALCVVCARLSHPKRLPILSDLFGRSPPWISIVFNTTCLHLVNTFEGHLKWHPQLRNYDRLDLFSKAVERVNNVPGIYGFVDNTFRGVNRPGGDQLNQRVVQSGREHSHGIVWQAIATPDLLISSLSEPFPASTNDRVMWQRSEVVDRINEVMGDRPEEEMLRIYGDPTYNSTYGIVCPFEGNRRMGGRHTLPEDEKQFNRDLAHVRITVEQAFGKIESLWTYTAFSKGVTLGNQPVAVYFRTAVLLTNCWTCLRIRAENVGRFGIDPPTVEDYLKIH